MAQGTRSGGNIFLPREKRAKGPTLGERISRLEAQRDALLEALEECERAQQGMSVLDDEVVWEQARQAIALVKGEE